jgi:hypothetical protein
MHNTGIFGYVYCTSRDMDSEHVAAICCLYIDHGKHSVCKLNLHVQTHAQHLLRACTMQSRDMDSKAEAAYVFIVGDCMLDAEPLHRLYYMIQARGEGELGSVY